MRLLDTTTPLDSFIGCYGPRWQVGILSDHADLFRRAGGTIHPGNGIVGWSILPGMAAVPVVCSEIVPIHTEDDGTIAGRCGNLALAATGTCDAHDPRPTCEGCGATDCAAPGRVCPAAGPDLSDPMPF